MSSGNVTLHPVYRGEAAIMKACPERAKRVEWETSLSISEIVKDSSTALSFAQNDKIG
jgi:hypothetical protein